MRILQEYLNDRYVMIVEPTVNYRTSIKQFLANLKVDRIKAVSSVIEATRELITLEVGLFIVEWNLPEKNGLQFCRELRNNPRFSNTLFLLITTENLKKDVVLASEVGINGYLLKPFSYEDFCSKIEQLVKEQQNPGNLKALLNDAEEAIATQNYLEAEILFNQALVSQPSSARAIAGLAKVAFGKKQYPKAFSLLEDAVRINPEFLDAHRGIVRICRLTGDLENLIKNAKELHELSPDNPKYTLILAQAYLELNELDESNSYFAKTIRISPKLADAYKGLGDVFMAKQEYEQARKNFQKALDLDSEDISTLNSLGLAHVRQGRFKEGVQKYLMAIKLDPYDPRIFFNLGFAYEKLGAIPKAIIYYTKALKLDGNFAKAKRGLERTKSSGSTEEDVLAEFMEEDEDIKRSA